MALVRAAMAKKRREDKGRFQLLVVGGTRSCDATHK